MIAGEIAPEPRGTNGFGYDPIFFYPPFGCTLAELDLDEKPRSATAGRRSRRSRFLNGEPYPEA